MTKSTRTKINLEATAATAFDHIGEVAEPLVNPVEVVIASKEEVANLVLGTLDPATKQKAKQVYTGGVEILHNFVATKGR